jgi:tetratricopeptide (TPR) repeat protein
VRLALVCVLWVAPLAAAAGPAEEERGVAREQARREGEEAEKRGDHAACAEAFLRAFDIDSRQYGDEYLYNAGVCLEQAGEVEPALSAYRRLARGFPRSRLRPHALVRSGNLHSRVARYDQAAALFEEYAALYAGEKDAGIALSEATRFRLALGQYRQAIALTRRWLKTFKHTPLEEARGLVLISSAQEEMGDRKAALVSLDQAERLARRDPDLAGWVRARREALTRAREKPPAPLPERYDRAGLTPDLSTTAPLAMP